MTDTITLWTCPACGGAAATDGFCDGCGSSVAAPEGISSLRVGACYRLAGETIEILRKEPSGDWAARSVSGRYYAASEWLTDAPPETSLSVGATGPYDQAAACLDEPATPDTAAAEIEPVGEAPDNPGEAVVPTGGAAPAADPSEGGPEAGAPDGADEVAGELESEVPPAEIGSELPVSQLPDEEDAVELLGEIGSELPVSQLPDEEDAVELLGEIGSELPVSQLPDEEDAVELLGEIGSEVVRAVVQFLTTVKHPSLPASHLTGRHPEAPLQLVFIEVDPNSDWIESQQLSAVAACRAGGQLAQLAHSAYASGWVMAAVRPGVLRWAGSTSRVSLTRFDGLCHAGEAAPPRTWGSATAPEMQLGGSASPAADVYSVAMIVAACLGLTPDPDDGELTEPAASRLSLDLVALLRRCTAVNAHERPSLQFFARELGRLRSLLGVRWAGATSVGRTREVQEDSWGALTISGAAPGPAVTFAAVADGMGGAEAGEIASRLAVRAAIAAFVAAVRDADDGELDPNAQMTGMRDAFAAAQDAVGAYATAHPEARTLASTFTAASVSNGVACIAHAGDSRLTLVRAGLPRQVTTDHNVASRLLAIGEITAEEAASHPQRSTLYRCLNADRNAEPEVLSELLEDGDRLVLTSDGIHGVIDDEMLAASAVMGSPAAAARELVSTAVRAGGYDNATAVVIQITSAVD